MTNDEIIDCTFCEHFLLCKKPEVDFETVCESFKNIYEECYEDEDIFVKIVNEISELFECSGKNDQCADCPAYKPHEFTEYLDNVRVCDEYDDSRKVTGILVELVIDKV